MTHASHFVWLSIAAAVATIGLKSAAWWITGSVSLASDALESFVNLAAAMFALWMVTVAQAPPDDDHPFGHGKAEYFSSGFEGLLILGAALSIIFAAASRLLEPRPLVAIDVGMVFSGVATAINLAVARVLLRASARLHSIALHADARHLLTDVWTSIGVIAGLVAVKTTGLLWLDPVVAIAVGLHILREGLRITRRAMHGLMDRALPEHERAAIDAALAAFRQRGVQFDSLRTRVAGRGRFADLVVRVPGDWTVDRGHALLDEIESAITSAVSNLEVTTHLEPTQEQNAAGTACPG
jgi:cation diffusion facilitator family transporter